MKVTNQTKYIAYFSKQKAPYFDEPDSGGWYSFSYTPLCAGLKDTKEEAKKNGAEILDNHNLLRHELRDLIERRNSKC